VSQIKERLKTRLKEEIDEENYVLIVLFHELKDVTHGHIEEYMQALQEAAEERNCQILFPISREDVESLLEDY
jgi:UDP-N-acetylglucosamine 2-epimerase